MVRYRYLLTSAASVLMLAGCGGSDSGGSGSATPPVTVPTNPTPTPTPTPAPAPTPTPSVTLFESPLNVLFIGGSITRGSNSSTPEKSYARLTQDWLQARFATVNVLNIAVGATGSEFGVYRYDRDAGSFRPDIAVIEYAVNDSDQSQMHFFRQTDGLIYKIRQSNPQVRIIYVAATQSSEEAQRRAGSRDVRNQWAQQVTEANGGTFVDAGADIWPQVIAGQRGVSEFFADTIHPNDLGHSTYAQALENALTSVLASGKSAPVTTTKYIAQSRYETARMVTRDAAVTASSCSSTSLTRRDAGPQSVSYFDQALSCSTGNSFTMRFTGTSVGVTTLNDGNSNSLACQIDGGSPITVTQPRSTWIFPQMLYHFLPDTNHVLSCTVTGQMIFGEFMVSSSQRITL